MSEDRPNGNVKCTNGTIGSYLRRNPGESDKSAAKWLGVPESTVILVRKMLKYEADRDRENDAHIPEDIYEAPHDDTPQTCSRCIHASLRGDYCTLNRKSIINMDVDNCASIKTYKQQKRHE